MLLDDASRWSVLAFASVHVLGLLTHHPVPWSATLAAVSLLVVAFAATVQASTGALRSLALLSGLAAAAGLVAVVEHRGGGAGWPFFLTEAPTGGAAWAEAALLTAAVVGLSAAALLPERGTEDRLRALRTRLVARLRAWYSDRRARVLDLLEPAPDPATTGSTVLDLGVLAPHTPASAARPRTGPGRQSRWAARRRPGRGAAWQRPGHGPAWQRPGHGAAWWRPRLAAAGVVMVTVLVAALATVPMWEPDRDGQTPILASRDRAGMLLATVPVLLAVLAATVAACLQLRRSRWRSRRWGGALAAVAFVVLAVPVVWERGGEHRFSAEPPQSALDSYLLVQGIDEVRATMEIYLYDQRPGWQVDPGNQSRVDLSHTVQVDPGPRWLDLDPGMQVHPGYPWRGEPDDLAAPAGWTDGSWWSEPFDWDEAGDGVVTGLATVAFLALACALLPLPRRPELLH